MSVIYCSQCGFKHNYNLAKPNFCTQCGGPLGAVSPSNKKLPAVKNKVKEDEYDDDEEYDDDDDDEDSTNASYVPDIGKLAVAVEHTEGYNTFNLGSIFGQPSESSSPRRRRNMTLDNFKNTKK
jgi:ribosomal protein L37E